VGETLSRFGEIHVLVNNAGVMSRAAPIAEFEIPKWDYTLSVNLRGPFLLSRAVLHHMLKAKKGSIINVSSSLGRGAGPNFGAYSVSKAALEALTRVLAEELKSTGIRVNSVDPGYVATKITHFTGSSPDSVAPVFVYLASDESKRITGMQLTASHWQSEIKRG
jgi:NAD(P)-dependent dehydrogenase (short-subunit alcohol dehydrogenase family)